MVVVVVVLIMAVSLSMDAFSLSLVYGTIMNNKKEILLLSLIVGIFHFFMPLLGMILASFIFSILNFNTDFLVFIILFTIGIQMIIQSFKEEQAKKMKIAEFFLFALAVSIDSFSVGFTLPTICENFIFSAICFSFVSFLFTLFGLTIGNKLAKSIGEISTIAGGAILMVISLFFIV